MKAKHLIEAIGLLDDTLIAQYDAYKPAKRKWLRPAIAAACICLLAGTGWGIMNGTLKMGGSTAGSGSTGHEENSSFMHYEGPVMPLTLLEENADVTASRELTFDFLAYSEPYEYYEYKGETKPVFRTGCTALDSYTLYNGTDADISLTALYPFTGSIRDLSDEKFSVSVDGEKIDPELLPGSYAGGFEGVWTKDGLDDTTLNLHPPGAFADYVQLLENGAYLERTLSDAPILDQPVNVYSFTENTAPEGYDAATQSISFYIDPSETTILSFGFEGGEWREDGFRRFSFFVPRIRRRESKLLTILGEDIADYTLQGYQNGACEEGNELDGVSSVITRTEMTLEQLMQQVTEEIALYYWDGEMTERQMQMTLRGAKELLTDYGVLSNSSVMRYDDGRLDDLISEAYAQERVFYAEIPLTIPAGGSINIDITLWRGGSYDYACSGKYSGIIGYDCAAHLGSNLDLTSQQVTLVNADDIQIVRQNFGFDLQNGITTVSIGEQDQYYMEVKKAEDQ